MIKKVIKYLKEDYSKRTFFFAGISACVSLAFAIYNGVIGFIYNSVWHLSVFGYYVLLMLIKALIVVGEIRSKSKNTKEQFAIVYISLCLLIIVTIAMIAPAAMLIKNERAYDWGLIPAITSAAYTTYCIISSTINMSKAKKIENIFIKEIKLINMICALMSVLVLQNTLILANGGYNKDMIVLSIVTTAAILVLIVILVTYNFIKIVLSKTKIACS